MKLSELYCYYINPDRSTERREKMNYIYKEGFKEVKRIVYNDTSGDRAIRMSKAHILALNTALDNNHYPVLILEDDAALMRKLPGEFNLDGDLIYWGGSNYNFGGKPDWRIEDYSEDYKRVFYMLSGHALLYSSRKSILMVLNILEKSILANEFNDIALAMESDKHLFLAPKNGFYFYQDDYTREVTKFDY